jgi:streptogramin lyase
MSTFRSATWLVALIVLLIAGPTASAGPYFALVGWRGEFARIDAATHDVEELINVLPHELQGIAAAPDGTLYAGPGTSGDLYTIDPEAGTAEVFLGINTDIRDMAFSPAGDLYVLARTDPIQPSALRVLSLVDGSYTEVGLLDGAGFQPQGLAFGPDGVLYAVRPNEDNYDLYTIDLDDTELHLVGSYAGDLHQGLTFAPDGSLYAVGPSAFGQLDPVTGAMVGDPIALVGDYRGITYVPEPATLVLLYAGGYLAGLRRRRTRRRA